MAPKKPDDCGDHDAVPPGVYIQLATLEARVGQHEEKLKTMDEKHVPRIDALEHFNVKVVAVFGVLMTLATLGSGFAQSKILEKLDALGAVQSSPRRVP